MLKAVPGDVDRLTEMTSNVNLVCSDRSTTKVLLYRGIYSTIIHIIVCILTAGANRRHHSATKISGEVVAIISG